MCITFIRLNSFEADNLLVMQKTHWLSSSNHVPERRRVTTNFTTHEVSSWLLLVILLQCHRIRFSNRLKRDFFGRQATHYVALLVNRVFSMTKLMITWLQGLWRIFVDFSLARFETMALLFIAAACSWRNHTKSGTAQMKLYEKEDQEFQEFLRPSDKNREWRWKCGRNCWPEANRHSNRRLNQFLCTVYETGVVQTCEMIKLTAHQRNFLPAFYALTV